MNFCKTYKNLQFLQLSIHWILNLGDLCLNTIEKAKATMSLLVKVVIIQKTTQIHPRPHRDFQALLNQKSLTTCEIQEQICA